MNKNYTSADKLEYNTVYELYKGHKSTEVHSSYNGFMYRSGSQTYQKIDNTEMINGSGFFLQISHDEKALVLELEQTMTQAEIDVSQALNQCKESSVEDKGTYYRVKMVFNTVSESPFSVAYLRIDKTKFTLLQIDLYYSIHQDFSTDFSTTDLAQSHLKIKFSKISTSPKNKEDLFDLGKYLKNKNNILSPTGSCEAYDLIDNRMKL
jgi:hypothetical protein